MDITALKTLFFRYILLPLIVIILAAVLMNVKKKLPIAKSKTIILYILISALCLGVPGFFGFSGNAFSPVWYILAMIIYLVLGIININLLQHYFKSDDKSVAFSILFESLISAASLLLGAYFFYLIFNWMSPYPGYAVMSATCMWIFVVPLSFYYCYLQFLSIPPSIYETWQPKLNTKPVEFERLPSNTRLLILNFEINRNTQDGKRFRVQAKTPDTGVAFGDWFYRIVEDYNYKHPETSIVLVENEKEIYSWIFYVKKSFFHLRRIVDFKNTVSGNGITDNSIIVCKRVSQHSEEGEPQSKSE